MNEKITYKKSIKNNKRNRRADDYLSLSSALRPRLLGCRVFNLCLALIIATMIFALGQNTEITNASAASLTLSTPASIAISEIIPTPSGTYARSSDGAINIKTDAVFGYNLDIKAKSDNNLVNGDGKITSILESISEAEFENNGQVNTWRYIPSKINGAINNDLQIGPTTSPTVIEKTSGADTNGQNYTIAIAAKVDNTIPLGIYKNNFIISAVANTVNYSVTYYLNDGVDGPDDIVNANTANSSITLENKTPTRDGFDFKGWCNQETNNENCAGEIYQPNQTYELSSGINDIKLWAMWGQNAVPMQNWSGCSGLEQGQVVSLRDTRDDKVYRATKLNDGNCWMTDDLRLGGDQEMQLTIENTNSEKNFALPISDQTKFEINNEENKAIYMNESTGYYSHTIAIGGDTPYYGISELRTANNSICPKGWRLPTKDEYDKLASSYTVTQLLQNPINFSLSGYIDNGDGLLKEMGEAGYYHSSDNNCSFAYTLKIDQTSSLTKTITTAAGLNARCITGSNITRSNITPIIKEICPS